MKRRSFIKSVAATNLMLASGIISSCSSSSSKSKILILGGTNFVGPAIVNQAIKNNFDITLFNRGITNPDLFSQLKLINGDRESGVSAYQHLLNETWDVVIDVWPEKSILVEEAVASLKNHAKQYIFISSIAVYNDFQEVGLHEESDVVRLDITRENWGYSEEKLAAENAVKTYFPSNHTILRPGAIKGWRDPSLDLLYWCLKLNQDDAMIAPGSGLDPIQFVDVNDVGKFTIEAVQKELYGTYNCVGPREKTLTWKDFLEISKKHFDSRTELIWANEQFLAANEVYSFSDLPLWAPLSEDRGFMQISNQKIIQSGFSFTDIKETLDDCMNWFEEKIKVHPAFGTESVNLGLDKKREMNLINQIRL